MAIECVAMLSPPHERTDIGCSGNLGGLWNGCSGLIKHTYTKISKSAVLVLHNDTFTLCLPTLVVLDESCWCLGHGITQFYADGVAAP